MFHAAIYARDLEVLRVLAEEGVNPTVRFIGSRTPLELAVDFNEDDDIYAQFIDILIQAEFDWKATHPVESGEGN